MPAIVRTEYAAEIVWLGCVPGDGASLRSEPGDRLVLGFDGAVGERHSGDLRASCSRVTMLHPKGTEIRNTRQLSVLSQEELDAIAEAIGLETLDPALLGASVVLRGISDFSHVPPSSRLQGPSGVTLVVDMENRPCVLPAREIEAEASGHGRAFKEAAQDRRGVTAWVERPGALRLGDRLELFIPDQRVWQP